MRVDFGRTPFVDIAGPPQQRHRSKPLVSIDVLVVVVFDLHDFITAREGPAEALNFAIAGKFSAACSSMLSERAPTPPRFIGHRTWTSRIGLRPNRCEIRVFTRSTIRGAAVSGSSALHEVEVAVALWLREIRDGALIDLVRAGEDPAFRRLSEDVGQGNNGRRR